MSRYDYLRKSGMLVNHENEKLKIVCVTGTVGKTTVIEMIFSLLCQQGYKVMSMGTNGIKSNESIKSKSLPATFNLDACRFIVSECIEKEYDFLLLEITAEIAELGALLELDCDYIVLTNFMEDINVVQKWGIVEKYRKAKENIFKMGNKNCVYITQHDSYKYFKEFFEAREIAPVEFGKNSGNYFYTDISIKGFDVKYVIDGTDFKTKIIAPETNWENICALVAFADVLKIKRKYVQKCLASFQIAGRFQIIEKYDRTFIIDSCYVGVRRALLPILEHINTIPHVVYCGFTFSKPVSDVKQWRKEYVEMMVKNCEYVYLTYDGRIPGNEASVIEDLQAGIGDATNVFVYENRMEAILQSIVNSKAGDTIILLGRGTEENYVYKGKFVVMSDEKMIDTVIDAINKKE